MSDEFDIYGQLGLEIIRRADSMDDSAELYQWLVDRVRRLGGSTNEEAVMSLAESFDDYARILEKRKLKASLPLAERHDIDWPWATWQKLIDPLEPGMLAVISAGTGMGKTIYAESITEHWASHNFHVAFVHYELNRSLMWDRRASRHTGILRRDLKSGRLTPEQERIVEAVGPKMKQWEGHIWYTHTPGWTMERTLQELDKLYAEDHCDVVVIDYLEKVAPSTRQLRFFGANQFQREADNVEMLKNWCESHEVPALMLAQLNKEGARRDIGDLDRTGLRGAGEKTEKANLLVLLSRKKDNNGYSNTIDVKIDKNTLGSEGVFQQQMQPEFFRVQDLTDKEPPSHWTD